MQLLTREAHVVVGPRGTVESINGVAPPGSQLQKRWFYYVNGIAASAPAAQAALHDGDEVWWDLHDITAEGRVSAVVGSFPEPFLHGDGGKRLPVRLICANPTDLACGAVRARFRSLGILAALGAQSGGGSDTLNLLVGRWSAVRDDPAAQALERGPRASGVFARPSPDGATITLLDAQGLPVRTLGPGTGLVAATRYFGDAPTWLVTGTDDSGLNAAAAALNRATLHADFAVAITQGRSSALPVA